MKLLLWAGIIFAVIWILKNKKSSAQADPSKPTPPPSSDVKAEAMLSCAHCKTYFPASEAVFDPASVAFCSEEHLRQHATH
jgi:uncharacterized protein